MAGNPIQSVGGVAVKTPVGFTWELEDVSAEGAGRAEDGTMHKMRIGQNRKLQLSWGYISTAEASVILKAFNPEYINVTYFDLMSGGYETREFYVGNRSVPLYNAALNLVQNVGFNIITRTI